MVLEELSIADLKLTLLNKSNCFNICIYNNNIKY